MAAKTSSGFYVVGAGKPQTQYGWPYSCRHCGCKLNKYNPFDVCGPCKETGKPTSAYREIKFEEEEISDEEMTKKLLKELIKNAKNTAK